MPQIGGVVPEVDHRISKVSAEVRNGVSHFRYRTSYPGDLGSDIGVLGLLMPAEVNLPLESSSAQVAGEGLESGVLAAVSDQV